MYDDDATLSVRCFGRKFLFIHLHSDSCVHRLHTVYYTNYNKRKVDGVVHCVWCIQSNIQNRKKQHLNFDIFSVSLFTSFTHFKKLNIFHFFTSFFQIRFLLFSFPQSIRYLFEIKCENIYRNEQNSNTSLLFMYIDFLYVCVVCFLRILFFFVVAANRATPSQNRGYNRLSHSGFIIIIINLFF